MEATPIPKTGQNGARWFCAQFMRLISSLEAGAFVVMPYARGPWDWDAMLAVRLCVRVRVHARV